MGGAEAGADDSLAGLMAVPGATIYSFDASPLREVEYDALEGVALLKGFLQAPGRYMRHLWRASP